MFAPGGGQKGPGDQPANDQAQATNNDSEMKVQLKQLSDTIDMMKNPSGKSKKTPVRSCGDLNMQSGGQAPSGMYWIDPNGGCESDAIQAYCDFENQETCVHPSNGKVNKGAHFRGYTDQHVYFGEMQNGYSFDYSPRDAVNGANYDSQVTFLRLLSTTARQTVTYHCKNSVAAFDKANRDYAKALKLLGSNGVEFSAQGSETYEIIEDGCMNAPSSFDKTVFQYTTKKTARLPIVDVAPVDIGDDKEFGIDMGPVCFK
jgi:collagen type I/II/III/V/XI/XXIV/XXVII alpha